MIIMDERPLDCSQCTRKANIVYKKVRNGEVTCCRMCSSCPLLQANIGVPLDVDNQYTKDVSESTKCKKCQTSLHEVTISGWVGCPSCYQTFEEFITQELSETGQVPLKPDSTIFKKKSIPIHLGKVPEFSKTDDGAKKLESLQSALTEAVNYESFERAASLRDQIKHLTEKLYGKEPKAS